MASEATRASRSLSIRLGKEAADPTIQVERSQEGFCKVLINGVQPHGISGAWLDPSTARSSSIHVYEDYHLIAQFPASAFRKLTGELIIEWNSIKTDLQFPFRMPPEIKYDLPEHGYLGFSFELMAHDWTNPWSIARLTKVLNSLLPIEDVRLDGGIIVVHVPLVAGEPADFDAYGTFPSLLFEFQYESEVTVQRLCELAHTYAVSLLNRAQNQCRAELDENSLVQYFSFPPETRSACEQYLAYFSQFLRDLGMEAISEIKEEANHILFSVKPRDGKVALQAVREALGTYLQLPSVMKPEYATTSQDVAAMQLQSNVMHLQSQLMLAHATIQAKDKAIEAQELALRVLGAAQRQLALPAPSEIPPSGKTEPVLGEVVRVGTYEKFGVHWNWAELVRKLKRRPPNE